MDPPTPFFGSKISLISKSKIRYEGFLYNIDPNDSTIALAKVKSFGTEDRSVDVPVPPRDDVFQLIIFRASDIQDLNVEDPNGVLPAPGLQDPAIVQAHPTSTSTSFPSSLPAQSQAQSSLGATVPTTSGQSINQQNRSKLQQSSNEPVVSSQEAKANKLVANQPQQNQQSGNNKQPFNRAVVRGNNAPNAGQQLTNKPRFGQDQQDSRNIPGGNNNQPRRQFPNQVGPQNNFQQRNGGNPFNLNFRQNGGFNPNYRNNNTFGNNGGYQANRRPNFNRPLNQGYPQSRPNPSGVPHVGAKTAFNLPLPDTEFDFEKAQTDFKILEEQLAGLKMGSSGEDGDNAAGDEKESQSLPTTTSEENTEEHEVVSPKYNKTKSFFDAISCEALEREKGPHQRVDWKIERKLNRETFGVVNTPRRVVNYRRGGGRPFHQNHYQGGGGGGGYRGNNPRFGGHQGGFQQRNNQHRPNFVQRSQQQPNQNRQQSNGVSTSGQPQQQQQQPKTLASVVAAGNKNAANTILAAVNGTA